ncbi:hypothetical protein AMAG_09196 [Allomyces macrogynus ATCC 38327]|uniref:60S ribosomal protein L8 n=1 Tax=Allomyces macrogynus (strain ATCC 38327) TaxID=578462 RepID=A0A0L0SNQ0_ALLM3|nr:hypothetical protein AMAG_09196 [Allomyces macrogynus ATCC 38327]|eukprot:KNE64143.1 hypothetical protein AMAG_09196 [Allomyces macrogynus ATCC 38327]
MPQLAMSALPAIGTQPSLPPPPPFATARMMESGSVDSNDSGVYSQVPTPRDAPAPAVPYPPPPPCRVSSVKALRQHPAVPLSSNEPVPVPPASLPTLSTASMGHALATPNGSASLLTSALAAPYGDAASPMLTSSVAALPDADLAATTTSTMIARTKTMTATPIGTLPPPPRRTRSRRGGSDPAPLRFPAPSMSTAAANGTAPIGITPHQARRTGSDSLSRERPHSVRSVLAGRDTNVATQLFPLLNKIRPETKQEKKQRLRAAAEAKAAGKAVEAGKKPIVVKYATALAIVDVKPEDKQELAALVQVAQANFNDKADEIRKTWGGGIMGKKSQDKTLKRQKALAKEVSTAHLA